MTGNPDPVYLSSKTGPKANRPHMTVKMSVGHAKTPGNRDEASHERSDPSSPDNGDKNGNNGKYQQDMDQTACRIGKESKQPANYQNYSNDVQYSSHNNKY
jgi:hypothetical protein